MKKSLGLLFSFLFLFFSIFSFDGMAGEAIVGRQTPDFTLTDTNGVEHSLSNYKGKFVVLEWNNPDCPFVKKHYDSKNMQMLQEINTRRGVIWLTINSSAPGKQGNYSAEEMNQIIHDKGYKSTAVLFDLTGEVGEKYGAKTTPHMFIINPAGELIYQGAIDDTPTTNPEGVQTATNYVQIALDEAMAGKPVSKRISQPYGCAVKY